MSDAISAVNARFMSAVSDGDSAAIAALYTANAKFMPPNADVVTGHEAIGEVMQNLLDAGIGSLVLDTVEIEEHGDTAIEEGRYTLGTTDGQTADAGKYLVIWKNDGGDWKLHKDIFNSSRPME